MSCIISLPLFAVYPDSFEAVEADNYIVDGVSDEACWAEANWYNLQYIWLPYGTTISASDFAGRVKFAWTANRLLVFAEITDNIFSDDHTNPTDQYWEDDCLEVFVDEDKSGGNHQNNYNAFAYHVSKFYDVVDLNLSGSPMLYNSHVETFIRSSGNTHYWEMAVKIFNDTYSESGSNTPVSLTADKEMGLTMAYCDNDETNGRENFIGLHNVSSADQNRAWQNADVFATLILKASSGPISIDNALSDRVRLYPNSVEKELTIEFSEGNAEIMTIQLVDLNGRVLYSKVHLSNLGNLTIDMQNFVSGVYIVRFSGEQTNLTKMVYKR